MKTLIAILLFVIAGLSATVYMQYRTNAALNRELADVPGLRLAKTTLIKELKETNSKLADANLDRQFAEEDEARWKRAITPLYTPAIIRRLQPVPLPDGTNRVVWPNPYDLPYLLNEYCVARR